jgi:hypothetical protein
MTKTEQRYETMLMALSGGQRVAMAGEMLEAAKQLVIAGMPSDGAKDERHVRRYLFLAFYAGDFDPAQQAKILAHLDAIAGWNRQVSSRVDA